MFTLNFTLLDCSTCLLKPVKNNLVLDKRLKKKKKKSLKAVAIAIVTYCEVLEVRSGSHSA